MLATGNTQTQTSGWIGLMTKPSKGGCKWGSHLDKSSFLLLLQPLTGRFHKGHKKERFHPIIWMWELVPCYFRRWLHSKYHFMHSDWTLNRQKKSYLPISWSKLKSLYILIALYNHWYKSYNWSLIQIIQLGSLCRILKPSMGYPHTNAIAFFVEGYLRSPTVRTEQGSHRKAEALKQQQLIKVNPTKDRAGRGLFNLESKSTLV